MFKLEREREVFFCIVCLLVLSVVDVSHAVLITQSDIIAITGNEVASGNGKLDLKLFLDASAHIDNSEIGFDGDDSNTDLPGGGVDDLMAEAYITSMGDIRNYYDYNFGSNVVKTIGLYIDINQTTNNPSLTLSNLSVIIDYDADFGDSRDTPYSSDVDTELQNSTTDGWSWSLGDPSPIGGTVVSRLDSAKILPLNQQGGGWADHCIDLKINPYDSAYSDETRILIYWESSNHDDGGETMFLSGSYAMPEPATFLLLAFGAVPFLAKKRRRV